MFILFSTDSSLSGTRTHSCAVRPSGQCAGGLFVILINVDFMNAGMDCKIKLYADDRVFTSLL